MTINTFIDQDNRVWLQVTAPVNDKKWLLLSDHGGYYPYNGRLEVGQYYSDNDLSSRSLRLHVIDKGKLYKFEPTFKSGEDVFVRFDFLKKVPELNRYNASADATVAKYVKDDECDSSKAVVEVQIIVDKMDIKKYK
jgi:hypothetical protein